MVRFHEAPTFAVALLPFVVVAINILGFVKTRKRCGLDPKEGIGFEALWKNVMATGGLAFVALSSGAHWASWLATGMALTDCCWRR